MIELGKYKHFKGNIYDVIGICKHSETNEDMVIYKREQNNMWVRPLSMFNDSVIYKDGSTGPRFKKIDNTNIQIEPGDKFKCCDGKIYEILYLSTDANTNEELVTYLSDGETKTCLKELLFKYKQDESGYRPIFTKIYDSTNDTLTHMKTVKTLILDQIIPQLKDRACAHDESKLQEPEKSGFDKCGPTNNNEYNDSTYKHNIETTLKEVLTHHYKFNRHHPEHFEDGVNNMTLIDLIEMLSDWKASTQRYKNGSIIESLKINKQRFKINDQLYAILCNTVDWFKWS